MYIFLPNKKVLLYVLFRLLYVLYVLLKLLNAFCVSFKRVCTTYYYNFTRTYSDLMTLTEEIFNGELHFLCSVSTKFYKKT